MARINHYIGFSDCFSVDPMRLDELGVLNPFLNADTPLFIDPLLLPYSRHDEISVGAKAAFDEHFGKIISLLKRSEERDDLFWRNAERQLRFPEVKGVCLGFGGASVSGSGSGPQLTEKLVRTAKEIVDVGYEDPNLFPVLALLEDGIGPDRISDMTAGVIEEPLYAFTQRVAGQLGVPVDEHRSRRGSLYRLPTNPYQRTRTPVLLVPLDVLRKMPIAKDWDAAMSAASENATIRHQVNTYIGEIFEARTKKEREAARRHVKAVALTNKDAFEAVVAMVDAVEKRPYDQRRDEDGFILIGRAKSHLPVDVTDLGTSRPSGEMTVETVRVVVATVIERFRFWIEDRRMSAFLWNDDGTSNG